MQSKSLFLREGKLHAAAAGLAVAILGASAARAGTDDQSYFSTRQNKAAVAEASGTFQTSVAIAVPPYHGLEPSISLSYSSGGGNGSVGVGWQLGGFSVIERVGQGRGAPKYDVFPNVTTTADTFLLNGEELVRCVTASTSPGCVNRDGTGTPVSYYFYTKSESYQRIRFDDNGTANTKNDDKWYVWSKDGTKTTLTPILDPSSTYTWRWGVSTVVDTLGNSVTYSWTANTTAPNWWSRPTVVSYNGNSVTLYWEPRPDMTNDLAKEATGLGFSVVGERLKTIQVNVNGFILRAYKLAYSAHPDTGVSQLQSVTEVGQPTSVSTAGVVTGGLAAPAPTFTYGTDAAAKSLVHAGNWLPSWCTESSTDIGTGDFNGDGKTDYFCHGRGSGDAFVALSSGTGMTSAGQWMAGWCKNSGTANKTFGVADFDADGKDDFYCRENSTGNIWVGHSNGSTGVVSASVLWASDWCTSTSSSVQVGFADFNADGRTDAFCHNAASGYVYVALSTGYSSSSSTWITGGGGGWCLDASNPIRVGTGDFDGDGMTDLYCHNKSTGNVYMALSTGSGFVSDGTWGLGWCSGTSSQIQVGVADFNGDSKADLYCSNSSTGYQYVALSTGHNGFTSSTWLSNWCISTTIRVGVADFNGDGRSDIYCRNDANGYTYVALSNSTSAFSSSTWQSNWCSDSSAKTGMGDFNGDGKSDIYCHSSTASNANNFALSGSKVGPTGLLESTTNGIGSTTTIAYGTSSDFSFVLGPVVRPVVTTTSTTDGRGGTATTTYSYTEGYFDDAERKFAGFRKVTKTLPCETGESTCPKTIQYFVNGTINGAVSATNYPACSGMSDYLDTYDSSGVARHRHNPNFTSTNADGTNPHVCLTTGTWETDYGPSGTAGACSTADHSGCRRTYTSQQYDSFGGVTAALDYGEYYDSANTTYALDETNVRTTYLVAQAAYVVKPNREDTFSGLGTTGTLLAQTIFYYDLHTNYLTNPSQGLVTRILAWNNQISGTADPQSNASAYVQKRKAEYDMFGNVTRSYDGLSSNPNYVAMFYDGRGRLTRSEQRTSSGALVQSTANLYDMFDRITSATDPNGVASSSYYDALSRITKAVVPGGATTTNVYPTTTPAPGPTWEATDPFVQTNAPSVGSSTMYSKTYFDGLGRVYRVVTQGIGQDTHVISTYTRRGKVKTTTLPFAYSGTDAAAFTTTSYDSLDRSTAVTTGTSTATTSYGLWTTTTSDPLGHTTVETRDGHGRVIVHGEKKTPSSGAYEVGYAYDLLGNVTASTYLGSDGIANYATLYSYNSLGQKLSMNDPDLGLWSYSYDANGLLTGQVDGKSQLSTMLYDAMGRVTKKTTPDGSTTIAYDETAARPGACGALVACNVGRVTTITYPRSGGSAQTDKITYDYDKDGRVTRREQTIDGASYVHQSLYDQAGRLTKVIYPDGDSISGHGYNALGQLTTIPGYASNALYDAQGRITSFLNGNTATTTYSYYATTNWLNQLSTKNSSGTSLLTLSHIYDADGRVTRISSATWGQDWSYAYDEFHLLTGATANPVSGETPDVQTISYAQGAASSPDGLIRDNSRKGSYGYDAVKKHALKSLAGIQTFTYDAGGNMNGWAGRSTYWDANNRVTKINGTSIATYFYDGEGEGNRVKRIYGATTTKYIGDAYEIANDGTVTKYISLGGKLIAKKVGTTSGSPKYWMHTDQQGGVRAITDSGQTVLRRNTYRPFGESFAQPTGTMGSSHAESLGYTGQRYDDLGGAGLIYLHARYYDPSIGRFISPDTLIPGGRLSDLDRYAYCNGDPINGADPSGHNREDMSDAKADAVSNRTDKGGRTHPGGPPTKHKDTTKGQIAFVLSMLDKIRSARAIGAYTDGYAEAKALFKGKDLLEMALVWQQTFDGAPAGGLPGIIGKAGDANLFGLRLPGSWASEMAALSRFMFKVPGMARCAVLHDFSMQMGAPNVRAMVGAFVDANVPALGKLVDGAGKLIHVGSKAFQVLGLVETAVWSAQKTGAFLDGFQKDYLNVINGNMPAGEAQDKLAKNSLELMKDLTPGGMVTHMVEGTIGSVHDLGVGILGMAPCLWNCH